MTNPLRQKMPWQTNLRIRRRLLLAWVFDHPAFAATAFLMPMAAVWVFFFVGTPTTTPTYDQATIVAEIRAAQTAELARAQTGIYHLKREIVEGGDKPAFVAAVLGTPAIAAQRVDVVDTYQHDDTALALIESNGTDRPFEAYLTRVHDTNELTLHHYGPAVAKKESARAAYDEAHDLRSLYTEYTTITKRSIPILDERAELLTIDEVAGVAHFRTVIDDTISIVSVVDLDTKLVTEDIIYVTTAGRSTSSYEMTRVTYKERQVIPSDQFDTVFDPARYDYTVLDTETIS